MKEDWMEKLWATKLAKMKKSISDTTLAEIL
jgi:hypothetical protein